MPAKRRKDGTYKDIAHPLNADTRDRMERAILAEYERRERASRRARASPATAAAARKRLIPRSHDHRHRDVGVPVCYKARPMDLANGSRGDFKVFTGNSNPALAEADLRVPEAPALEGRWSAASPTARSRSRSARTSAGSTPSSSSPPARRRTINLMELLIMCDALKRASAGSINAVIPYYGYARQDRKVAPRTPITAKLVADLLEAAGATRVVSMDMHAGQIQGFFNIPFDHLYASPVLLERHAQALRGDPEDLVIVSPDAGGVERARAYSKRLDADLGIIDKRRPRPTSPR